MAATHRFPLRQGSFDLNDSDALVLIGPAPLQIPALPPAIRAAVDALAAADPSLGRGEVAVLSSEAAPGGRVVLAPTGPLTHWTEDVRRYAEATLAGVVRALRCGAQRPAVAFAAATDPRFAHAALVTAASALAAGWRHPQHGGGESGLLEVSVIGERFDGDVADRAAALEVGRSLARDLTAGDPEFTSPEAFAAQCERAFDGTAVRCEVRRDAERLVAENPLLGAVARASMAVERHHPRVVVLHYDGGDGPHALFAGKGVTYDTGGADLKVGGAMRGMSMDKGGAAGVAGFFAMLDAARPRGFRATAWLGCVRNSIGADSYVSDEILESRAGVPVVVGNTDAEGRMVLADMLAGLADEAARAADPVLFSVATLTGHVGRAYGPYAAVMGNGVAVEAEWPRRLQRAGELLGDPFEWSMIRREDYEMVAAKTRGGPILQCNNEASVSTPRGHQFPFCFLEQVAGLDQFDAGATTRIPFMHLDVAYSAVHKGGPMAGLPTGSPIPALAGALLGWAE